MKNFVRILAPFVLVILFSCSFSSAKAQELTQVVRGSVFDAESESPLIGATIIVKTCDPIIGATTDLDGNFRLDEVPVGRHDIFISFIGYEPTGVSNLDVTSGKEVVLNLTLQESATQLEVAVVESDKLDKSKALNNMATVSARSFSVEETGRYAFSAFDPARMALNYAGVSVGGGEDLFNEIIIRGNSPAGVVWRLEGVEIPNPNHFGSLGNSGGGISMLSSSTLTNSDFYTGAFPAEYGNALSGVFDLSMRAGNNQQREHSVMIGALGVEVATEGPLSANSRGSYLFNYRYSTLGLLNELGLNPAGDVLPSYQDLSFKINLPTNNAGTFALFGLGGTNLSAFNAIADSSSWEYEDDREGFSESQRIGTIGLSHKIHLNESSYLKTVALASVNGTTFESYYLDPDQDYKKFIEDEDFVEETTFRVSSMFNTKINAKNTLRTGAILSYKELDFYWNSMQEQGEELTRLFDNSASTMFIQGYAQWKHRWNDQLTLNSGVHYSLLEFNNAMAIEPRVGATWQINNLSSLNFGAGLHSKMENLALYKFQGMLPDSTMIEDKSHLGLSKSAHFVLGYDRNLNEFSRIKIEAYYQYLFNIPVNSDPNSQFSLVNTSNIWQYLGMTNAISEGTGSNIGVDVTLEKFFADNYYYMVTASLYDSKYKMADGREYNTNFNGNYQLNVLGGKEFPIGQEGNKVFGVNLKYAMSGGRRFTPVDLEASQLINDQVLKTEEWNEGRTPVYYRFDIGLKYKINREKTTHSIMFDIQNLTNRQNVFLQYYDDDSNQIESYYQTGLFPNFNYRIEF